MADSPLLKLMSCTSLLIPALDYKAKQTDSCACACLCFYAHLHASLACVPPTSSTPSQLMTPCSPWLDAAKDLCLLLTDVHARNPLANRKVRRAVNRVEMRRFEETMGLYSSVFQTRCVPTYMCISGRLAHSHQHKGLAGHFEISACST